MASVPNMRAAPLPIPPGQVPTGKAPRDFVCKIAPLPEEPTVATTPVLPALEDGQAPAPDVKTDGTAIEGTEASEVAADAAQLAAIAPFLQSLPAIAGGPAAPAPTPAQTPVPTGESKAETVAAAPTPTGPACALRTLELTPTPKPAPKSAPLPAPAAEPATEPAQAQAQQEVRVRAQTGQIGKLRPDVQAAAAEGDTVLTSTQAEQAATLETSAKEAVLAAKRMIEAALHAAPAALAHAAPQAAPVVSAALQAIGNALPHMQGSDPKAAVDDLVSAASLAMQTAPTPAPSAAGQAREAAPSAAAAQRTLDIANDAEWLDRLARDIAQASGNEGTIRFKLHPNTLGSLRVELSQGEHGTSVRLTADTEHARAILADAQPRLVAEARAQGVRIAETHVDLSGSDRHASGDPRRQDDRGHNPIIRTARDAAASADAPERPGRSRSDRYA